MTLRRPQPRGRRVLARCTGDCGGADIPAMGRVPRVWRCGCGGHLTPYAYLAPKAT